MVLSLVMLDITAAFDVINHQLLLQKCQSLQIVNAALKWIERYLNNHTQFVLCNAHKSLPSRLTCGVPQGSILGPLLFLIFIGDITKVFSKHYVDYLLYADDIQLFTRSSINDLPSTIISIHLDSHTIKTSRGIRDLEVLLDEHLTLENHVFMLIRIINKVRQFLSENTLIC
jgi:hypothetical protein